MEKVDKSTNTLGGSVLNVEFESESNAAENDKKKEEFKSSQSEV